MRERLLLLLILCVSALALGYATQTLSISYNEAEIFFNGNSIAHVLAQLSTQLLGQNDFALRLPFILFHLGSIVLLYKIGKLFLKRRLDRILSITIYAFLPGVNSVALLVNNSVIVMFITLLFVYLYLLEHKIASHIVLVVSLFVDNSFAIFYIALLIFSLFNKKMDLFILTSILLCTSLYLYGFDTGGKPKGYFMDTLGIYAVIFSPFIFFYFVYAMYRILIKEEKNILWYISFCSLVVSLLLSLRQRLLLEDFAPFVVLAVPLMIKIFFNSYRVRLPQFRKWHTLLFGVAIMSLMLNTLASYAHLPLYALMENPNKHFAIKYHVAKELARMLKEKGIEAVNATENQMQLRLKFYGIKEERYPLLSYQKEDNTPYEEISVSYYGKEIRRYYLY